MSGQINAIKILGSLLGSGAMSSGTGASILNQVIGMATGGGGAGGMRGGGGGLGGLLGGLLGGGRGGGGGGLGGLLGGLMGGGRRQQPGGMGMGSGGGGGGLGGLDSLLGGLMGGGGGAAAGGAGLGGLLTAAINQYQKAQRHPESQPNPSEDLPSGVSEQQATEQATLLVQAMINAAKADGRVDASEQAKISDKLGNTTPEEDAWLQQEIAAPLDVDGFVNRVPAELAPQVYMLSLMAIDLDSRQEAQYLDRLAQGIGIDRQQSNQIHQQLGVQPLYS